MSSGARVVYEFGPFRLDPEKQTLLRNEQPVPITPKTFETLLVLVRHSREVVSKDQLMREVWPDSFVEEANLTQNIFMLRKALGDSPDERRFIATLSGKGYRFTAEVHTVVEESPEAVTPSRSRSEIGFEETDGSASEIQACRLPATTDFASPQSVRTRWQVLASIVCLLAAIVWAAVFITPARHPQPIARNTLVLADFDNTTGDPIFKDTLRQGLEVQLDQSPFLQLISPDRVRQALGLMGRSPDAPLTAQIGREVCERTASAAVIDGSIARVETQYVLTVRAIDCNNGEILAEQQAKAQNQREVLRALDAVASGLRTRLGESLSSIEQHDVPLELATTPSLDALRAYSAAMRADMAGGYRSAFPLFKRAVELDPRFALAHAVLGLKYSEMGESQLARENTAKAYEFRDHATDRERFFIISLYHRQVTGNLEQEQQTLEVWAQTYPRDPFPHALLSGFATQGLGEYDRAIREARIALLGPTYMNTAFAYAYMGHIDESEKAVDDAFAHKLTFAELTLLRYHLAFLKGDSGTMQRAAAQAMQDPSAAYRMLFAQAQTLAYAGHLQAAHAQVRSAVQAALQAGQNESAGTFLAAEAIWEALSGHRSAALAAAHAATRISNARDTKYAVAFALASSSDLGPAAALTRDLEQRFPEDTCVQTNYLPALRGYLALRRHQPAKALQELELARPHELAVSALAFNYFFGTMYPVYLRGQAYLALGRSAEAAAEFQKLVDRQGLLFDDVIGPLSRLQLARAFAANGESTRATAAYDGFLKLWQDADPDAPVYRQAKRERARISVTNH